MGSDNKRLARRQFIEKTVAAGGIAGLTATAGCTSEEEGEAELDGGDDTPDSADEEDLGEPLPTFTYFNNPEDYNPARHDAINLIVEQLNEAGLDVEAEVLEWGTLFSKVTDEYDYNFATWSHGLGQDPGRLISEFFHEDNTGPGEGNFFGYENSEVSALLEEQFAKEDAEERAEVLHEVQEILAEEVPMHPILELQNLMAHNSEHVSGWVEHLNGFNYLYNMINIEVDNEENELRGSWSESLETLSPVGHNSQTKVLVQLDVLYDFLTRVDSDLRFDPETSIAQSIERPDLQTAVVEIRNDHQWHDGEPLTAEDVAFTYNYISEENIPVYHAQGEQIAGAEAIDEETVEIDFTLDLGPFETVIGVRLPIIPKHIWEDVSEPANHRPEEHIGSGVMEVEYWDEGSELSLVPNEDHWLDVDFDRRIWRIIPELSTNWELLEQGELNYLPFSRMGREMAEREEEPNISVAKAPEPRWWHCSMNLRQPGLDEVAVRRAVGHSLPRETINEQLVYGYADTGKAAIPEAMGIHHNPDVREYEYGTDLARKQLREGGFVFDEDGKAHYSAD